MLVVGFWMYSIKSKAVISPQLHAADEVEQG